MVQVVEKRVTSRYWQRVWNYRSHYSRMLQKMNWDNETYIKAWAWRQAGEISIKKAETIGGWDGEVPSGEIGLR